MTCYWLFTLLGERCAEPGYIAWISLIGRNEERSAWMSSEIHASDADEQTSDLLKG